jgi:hypothetical protein
MRLSKIVRLHKVNVAILLFIVLFGTFHYFKPAFAYDQNGVFRPFGVGYSNKTVVPVWLVAILLGIFSYLAVLVYISSSSSSS